MKPEIQEIAAEDTLEIRHKVMWPQKPLDYVRVPNDNEGKHFGLFVKDEMIAVISVFVQNNEAQFRKFATLDEYQGQGFGTLLLKFIIENAKRDNLNKLWCNARLDKSKFYQKFGFTATDKQFEKGGITFVIMEKIIN